MPSSSTSVKIQIMGRKVYWRWKGKTLLGVINKPSVFKSLLTSPSNPQVKFSANNLNFCWKWRWCDQIHAFFLNLFYFWNCNFMHHVFLIAQFKLTFAFNQIDIVKVEGAAFWFEVVRKVCALTLHLPYCPFQGGLMRIFFSHQVL